MAARRKNSSPSAPVSQARLTIESVGHQGDGVANHNGNQIFIPYTLAGEVVEAEISGKRGTVAQIMEPSAERQAPLCEYFTSCGGCDAQHFSSNSYLSWKQSQIATALSARAIETKIKPIIEIEPETRRRAAFVARRVGSDVLFGFHKAKDKQIEDITACPLLVPLLNKHMKFFRVLAKLVAPRKGELRIQVLACDNGLDIVLTGADAPFEFETEQKLTLLCSKGRIARLSIADEVFYSPQPPKLAFGAVEINPPAGMFTQAAAPAEEALAQEVQHALQGCKSIADLFSGCGTFALRLAASSKVIAYEMEGASLNALQAAADITKGLKTVKTERRDLFRRPVMADELKYITGVVIDPPRAGALEQ